MKEKACSIGIDIGTTSVKALCTDSTGKTVFRAQERLELISTTPEMAEQDANYVYETVTNLLAKTVRTAKQNHMEPALVGMSAAMHSLIAVSVSNVPLTNAMLWLDRRAGHAASRIWNSADRKIYSHTGTPIHAMSPFIKLIWFAEHFPDEFAKTHRFVSLKEWIWYKWFGEWCIDESIASATGLYNLNTRQWDEDALRIAKITDSQLSRLVETSYTNKDVKDKTLHEAGISEDVWFNIGASDGVLANLAHNVTTTKAMVLTVGTSLAIRTGVNTPITNDELRSFCYVLGHEKFIIGAPSNNGGIVMDWLVNQILNSHADSSSEHRLSTLCQQAGTVETGNLLCIPHVAGERAPVWDEQAFATFSGLNLHHTKLHMVRSAIEGILFNAYTIGLNLIQMVGRPEYIVVSGKLFAHNWIRKLTADLFGIPVHFQDISDASTIGAIAIAKEATASLNLFSQNKVTQTVPVQIGIPDASSHLMLAQRYKQYIQLYEAIHQTL